MLLHANKKNCLIEQLTENRAAFFQQEMTDDKTKK